MALLNPTFQRLKRPYIFPIIEEKLAALKEKLTDIQIVNLGIGDAALPLAPSIAEAIKAGVDDMSHTVKGYGPSNGYAFLREAIAQHEFSHVGISADEIFISDGANSDTVNIQELFCQSSVVAIANPTYPAYLDANIIAGKEKIIFLPCLEENNFAPQPPDEHCDLIYLCSPNNPTGVAMSKEDLQRFVNYALRENAILLLDNAYEAFITSPNIPRTIFEIPGAKECAIEFRSFSKSAGFTGLRCAYTILPKNLRTGAIHALWTKRQAIKFNGVAYPIQRGAEATYSADGKKETRAQVESYLLQAQRIKEGLKGTCYGGIDSPYLWWKTPAGMTSWQLCDLLLEQCQIISIPGSGFGTCGEGFVRLSAFCTEETATLALQRLTQLSL